MAEHIDYAQEAQLRFAWINNTGGAATNGVTVRDYFAAKAMQAILTSPEFLSVVTAEQALGTNASERVSKIAYKYSDAMMTERSK